MNMKKRFNLKVGETAVLNIDLKDIATLYLTIERTGKSTFEMTGEHELKTRMPLVWDRP
jgi:hypothetical protein